MKRDQAGKDFHVLHKTRHQNTACLHNFSLHEAADFHLPKSNSVGRHIQRCAGPAYSVPVAPVLRHEMLSAFHPTQHMHTEAFSWPGVLTPARVLHGFHICNTTSTTMVSAPTSGGHTDTRLQNCLQSVNCHATVGGRKGGALGFIPVSMQRS